MSRRFTDFSAYFSLLVRLEEDIFTQRSLKVLLFADLGCALVYKSDECDAAMPCFHSAYGSLVVRSKAFKWDKSLDSSVSDQWKWSCFRKSDYSDGTTFRLDRDSSRQINLNNCSRSLGEVMKNHFKVDRYIGVSSEEIYVMSNLGAVDDIEEMSPSSVQAAGEAGMCHT